MPDPACGPVAGGQPPGLPGPDRRGPLGFPSTGDGPTYVAIISANLGDALRAQDRREEALAVLGQALRIRQRLGDGGGQAVTLDILGRTHFHFGAWDDARACWEEALALSRSNHLPRIAENSLRGLDQLARVAR